MLMNQVIAELGLTLRYKSKAQALITSYSFSYLCVLKTKTQCGHSSTFILWSRPLYILVQIVPSPRAPARKSNQADIQPILHYPNCGTVAGCHLHRRFSHPHKIVILANNSPDAAGKRKQNCEKNLTVQIKSLKRDIYIP